MLLHNQLSGAAPEVQASACPQSFLAGSMGGA